MEYEGKTFSNRTADNQPDVVDKSDTKEADDHMEDSHKQAEKDAADISKTLMSRKQRGLLQAIEVCALMPCMYLSLSACLLFHIRSLLQPCHPLKF